MFRATERDSCYLRPRRGTHCTSAGLVWSIKLHFDAGVPALPWLVLLRSNAYLFACLGLFHRAVGTLNLNLEFKLYVGFESIIYRMQLVLVL